MAGLAKEFEQLGCWESATEEENIAVSYTHLTLPTNSRV